MTERLRILCLADETVFQPEGVLFPGDPTMPPYPESCQTYVAYMFAPEGDSPDPTTHFLDLPRSSYTWNPIARLRVLRLIRRVWPDAVIVRGPAARIVGLSMAELSGVASRVVLAPDLGHWLSPSLLGPIRRSNSQATRFITDSFEASQRLVRQEQAARSLIDVMRWGVDHARFSPRTEESIADAKHSMGLSAHQPVILSAGRLTKTLDLETLLYATRQLLPHQKEVRLLLWGGGTPASLLALREGIQRHGLEEHVIFPPGATSLEACIAAADVGVVTSYAESCSPYILLFMAAGLPTVAVNAGGNGAMIRHGESGYLVNFKDPDQLAMFVTILLLSPELAQRMATAARERAMADFPFDAALRARDDYFRTLSYSLAPTR